VVTLAITEMTLFALMIMSVTILIWVFSDEFAIEVKAQELDRVGCGNGMIHESYSRRVGDGVSCEDKER
jgi:hypothetical protein